MYAIVRRSDDKEKTVVNGDNSIPDIGDFYSLLFHCRNIFFPTIFSNSL